MWKYFLVAGISAGIGVVGGIFLEKLLRKFKDTRILKCSELLEKNFGSPIYSNNFTIKEVTEWFEVRKDKIDNDYKGIVMKINKETFDKMAIDLKIEKDLNKYLLLGIFKEGSFSDTLLVKYEFLENKLNDALKEGIMVIEKWF